MASLFPIRTNQLVLAAIAAFALGASSVQCGSGAQSGDSGAAGGQGGSTAGGLGAGGSAGAFSGGVGGSDLGFDVQTMDYTAEQFFANDPPPMTCDGGGQAPPVPGGSPECPDDKNLQGCPCPTQGQKVACWPGLRKNRDHGICHDGMTTCTLTGETALAWGPCVGDQLPTGTSGKESCGCFSAGHWAIDNLSPCFVTQGSTLTAISTVDTSGQGVYQCPSSFNAAPTSPWSKDRLTVDCTGNFTLCYTLKAGDGANPKDTDCTVTKVCTTSYYSPAASTVEFPPLPGWISAPSAAACVKSFVDSGGYGVMSVDGQSDECELVSKAFQTVTYCPSSCNEANPPAMCAQCMAGGGGSF